MGLIMAYDFHVRISNCVSGRRLNDEDMQTSESAVLAEPT